MVLRTIKLLKRGFCLVFGLFVQCGRFLSAGFLPVNTEPFLLHGSSLSAASQQGT